MRVVKAIVSVGSAVRAGTRRLPRGLLAISMLALVVPALAQPVCLECHEAGDEPFDSGVHGDFDCTDCHLGAETVPHEEDVGKIDCALCHDDTVGQYEESVHGVARGNGTAEVPGCVSCHGAVHGLRPGADPDSPVHPTRLAQTCGSCHSDPEVVKKFGIPVARPIEAFLGSVHARALAENGPGASCGSCHGTHAIFDAADPRSSVNHQRVPDTCGQCHSEIAAAYRESVHGRAAAHGARESPVCTDCHGEHRILAPGETSSPVFASNVPKMTCGRCHGDLRLAEKYGISGSVVPAYADSYHGLASRSGALTVAHCGSCHGIHDILPSSDPASHVYKDNLPATCGQCHPGAGSRFAIGMVHIVETERQPAAVYYVRLIYLWIIYLTIGGMLLHNLLDLQRKVRSPALARNDAARAGEETRMSLGFRIAHGLLLSSFIVLVYTGFALTYPEAAWARPVLGWEATFGLRGWLHRAASLVLLFSLAFHLLHLAVDRRARACIAAMRPSRHDLLELVERLRYYVGRRAEPPRSPAVGYAEKLEYIALMWGIAIMAVTGFLLWFDSLVLRFLPKSVTDVATVIHFYEAVLASLAVLVWHIYFVIFDPVVYPMDGAWLTGRSAPGRAGERDEPSER